MRDKVGTGEHGMPDPMRTSLDAMLADAARTGGSVSVGRLVQALQGRYPELPQMSPIELAEAILREASAQGIPVVIG